MNLPPTFRAPLVTLGAVVILVLAGVGALAAVTTPAGRPSTSDSSGATGHHHSRAPKPTTTVNPTTTPTSATTSPTTAPTSATTSLTTSPTTAPTSATTSLTTSPTTAATSATTSPTSATTSASGSWSCTVALGDGCGPYSYAGIPMSNGYDTYVSNQNTGAYGTQTVYANNPGDWQIVANLSGCGGCVQTYPNVQQLTNDWGGSTWNGSQDTPLDALSTLTISYGETSPASGASYEFSPDIWDTGYAGQLGSGSGDIMFWVDTQGRCDEGAFGSTVLGHAVLDGQNWTVHRYGGYGAEIIFVLDGPGGSGTCASQPSGTIDIKAGMSWLVAGGFIPAHPVLSQVNTGWEITQSSGATFTMHHYAITAN